jgi:hypothetical protein
VNLRAAAAVGLKCALRHETALLILSFEDGCPAGAEKIFYLQAKIEYNLSASKPQRTCFGTSFSQTLVQLGAKKKIA